MPRPALIEEEITALSERAGTAALKLYEQGNLDAVSMRSVGGQLGLTGMALYRYFPDGKSGLIAQMRVLVFRRFARVLADPVSARRSPKANIIKMLHAAADFAVANPGLYRLMFSFTQDADHDVGSAVHAARRNCWKPLNAVFTQLTEEHGLAIDADEVGHLFVAAAHGLVMFHLSGQPYPERRLSQLDLLLELLFEGILADGLKRSPGKA